MPIRAQSPNETMTRNGTQGTRARQDSPKNRLPGKSDPLPAPDFSRAGKFYTLVFVPDRPDFLFSRLLIFFVNNNKYVNRFQPIFRVMACGLLL
jgi:hypothetical protein